MSECVGADDAELEKTLRRLSCRGNEVLMALTGRDEGVRVRSGGDPEAGWLFVWGWLRGREREGGAYRTDGAIQQDKDVRRKEHHCWK